MALLKKKSTPTKRTSTIEPRGGRRRAPLPPWLKVAPHLPWFLLWFLLSLSLTFDAVIHVHSDATIAAHVREK
jgi:hypothetical protein